MDKKLYDALVESGDVTEPFEQFRDFYSQPQNNRKLYDVLKESGDVTEPYEQFAGFYFPTASGGQKKNHRGWFGRFLAALGDGFRRYSN